MVKQGEFLVLNSFLDFFLYHGFIFELFISSALFVCYFKRRKLFALRLLGALAVFIGISFFWNYIEYSVFTPTTTPIYVPMIKYVSNFALLVLAIYVCFDKNLTVSLFCGIAGFSTQHGTYKLAEIILRLCQGGGLAPWLCYLLYVLVEAIVYVIVFLAFSKKIRDAEEQYLQNKPIIYLAIALILYTTMFQYSNRLDMDAFIIYALYDILCSVFTLSLQFGILRSGKIQHELQVMEHLHHLEKTQYDASKKNMELLNIKFHDLKHLISTMGNVSFDDKYELERAIAIYDTTIKTGNETIDVILAEKSIFCDQIGVRFEKIVDGKLLSFMREADVYSLFGNAIDNAIEAVKNVADVERRVVTLMVRETRGMILIRLENFFDGEIEFEDGLPVTTKENKLYHGYGTKSIRNVVGKYGGDLFITAKNGLFELNVLFPLPTEENHKNTADEL